MVSTRTALRHAAIAHDDLPAWLGNYDGIHIDIGAGDGTFALEMARRRPDLAVLGIDTNLDNLKKVARMGPSNLRFIARDAMAIPDALYGVATDLSINFPYGSLLLAVACGDDAAWNRLLAVAGPGAWIDIRVNESAGAEYGLTVDAMRDAIARMMRRFAPRSANVEMLPHDAMRAFPTTWAKRLAYGRPSRVIVATARIGV